MAKSGLKHIDVGAELTKMEWESEESHELLHGTSFPDSPVERQLFYRDDEHKWYIYNGTDWLWLGGGSGGGGDMYKSVYDTDDDGVVDAAELAANSLLLEGSTKAEVRNHAPIAHKTTHQDGGSDELSVAGLSGELADPQKSNFLKLSDTPSSYSGQSGKVVKVKSAEDGVEFAVGGGGGMEVHGNEYHDPDFATEADFLSHKERHGYLGADEFSLIRPISQRAIPLLVKNWADTVGFTTSFGTGCGFTVGWPYGTLYTSTTNNQEAIIYSTAGFYQAYAAYGYSWGMKVSIRQGGTQVIGIGLFATPAGIDLLPGTKQNHIGFIVDSSGNLLASSGNGNDITQTDTDIDITGSWDVFLSIYANNVGIYYYVNHVLVATHLLAGSYYPNATNCYFTTFIKNTDSLAKSIFITPLSMFAQFAY